MPIATVGGSISDEDGLRENLRDPEAAALLRETGFVVSARRLALFEVAAARAPSAAVCPKRAEIGANPAKSGSAWTDFASVKH